MPADDATSPATYARAHSFDQAVHLIRNPVDSIFSEWQLAHSIRNGELDHSARLDIGLLGMPGPQGAKQKIEVLRYARNWARQVLATGANTRGLAGLTYVKSSQT